MITKEFIQSDLGEVCRRLGHPVANAYHWASTGLTEQQLLDEWEVLKQERQVEAQPSLSDQLAHAFNQLPLSVQATFAPFRLSIEDALDRDNPALAKEIINQVQVPAELEDTKTALLAMFD